jgi:ribosomal protein L11 methyltransferase
VNTHSLIEISLPGLDEAAAQSVAGLFDRWGRGGAVIEQVLGEGAGSSVKAYLLPEDDHALRQIEIGLTLLDHTCKTSGQGDAAPLQPLPAPRIRFLAETDWAEAWKAGYQVLRVGRRLVIKPTWRDYTPQPDDLIIELDPGMAFGSGLHPTTQLCLEAIEDYLPPGASVLDVGAGSGILAIAAARLGASHVLALDTDPLAVRIARENVALNQLESLIQVQVGTVPIANTQWAHCIQSPISDLVVANILAETIVELAPALESSLSPRGILVASGIILDRAQAVLASLHTCGLSLVERRTDGEWAALIAQKT